MDDLGHEFDRETSSSSQITTVVGWQYPFMIMPGGRPSNPARAPTKATQFGDFPWYVFQTTVNKYAIWHAVIMYIFLIVNVQFDGEIWITYVK